MELRIGAPVDRSDEGSATLTRIVVDLRSWVATHVVVEPTGGHLMARLVPIELVAEAFGHLKLTCAHDQWCSLEHAEDVRFLADPATGSWGEVLLWPLAGLLGGAGAPVVIEHVPPGEVAVSRTSGVEAADGSIGRVGGVVVDAGHRVTDILLREGHFWRKKDVAIPVGSVDGLAADIHVALSKHEIADLPAWSAPPPSEPEDR